LCGIPTHHRRSGVGIWEMSAKRHAGGRVQAPQSHFT
jgi:hypothetical protein